MNLDETAAVAHQLQSIRERLGGGEMPRSFIRVTGSDAAKFLHNFCTADVKALGENAATEAFFLNVKGKVIGYALISRDAEGFVINVDNGCATALMNHLDRYIISEDVELHDASERWAEVIVTGPETGKWLSQLGVGALPEPGESLFIADVCGGVTAVAWVGGSQSIYRLRIQANEASNLLDSLTQCGGAVLGEQAVETLRIESRWPRFGDDITDANLAQEIDRNDEAISLQKGCYLGQETVARLDAMGHVNKVLVKVVASGSDQLQAGDELSDADKVVGQVTSAVASHERNGSVGLAYVRTSHLNHETLQSVGGNVAIEKPSTSKPVD